MGLTDCSLIPFLESKAGFALWWVWGASASGVGKSEAYVKDFLCWAKPCTLEGGQGLGGEEEEEGG